MRRIAILLRRLDVLDWLVLAILVACFVSLGWNRAHEVRAQSVAPGWIYISAEPFDETPQEWATYVWATPSSESENDLIYYLPVLTEVKHVGCVDPRRVLLSSEDGKKHCYSFYSLAATANPDAEK